MSKFLDNNGLLYYDKEQRKRLLTKVNKVDGKGLSTNDLTNELKANYDAAYTHSQQAHAPSNAERNVLIGVKVNGAAAEIGEDRTVNIAVPTGALASKNNVAETDLAPELAEKVNAASEGNHSHLNKAVLDQIQQADLDKLDGIEAGANKTVVDAALDAESVNPVQNKAVKAALDGKADSRHTHSAATQASDGFLSATDKKKLDGIAEGANNYVHPTHDAHAAGLYKVAVDAEGHVTEASAVEKADITALGIPAQDTTYAKATAESDGLLAKEDKSKLDAVPSPGTIATETSVAAAIAAAGHIKKQIVEAKPSPEEAQDNIIYLVPKTSVADGNIYDEYWKIGDAVELIGDTATKIEAITNKEIDTILATE